MDLGELNARELYYAQRRAERLASRSAGKFDLNNATAVLKELYSCILDEKQEIEKNLIVRYGSKVSWRLSYRLKELRKIGKSKADEMMRDFIFRPKPLLELIKKDAEWRGSTHYAPITFNK